ncbi:hypothetical protein BN439_pEA290034 (plasmid) [Erwinia amylovora Ea644]|nr:hypothetical protein BN439_pEA290034 [Erwinia amylovora Ea644]
MPDRDRRTKYFQPEQQIFRAAVRYNFAEKMTITGEGHA